jgi:hypothetical protein
MGSATFKEYTKVENIFILKTFVGKIHEFPYFYNQNDPELRANVRRKIHTSHLG